MAGLIKICGLVRPDDAIAAARLGATHIGLVFHAKSPRHLDSAAAQELVLHLKQSSLDDGFAMPGIVGLFVDPRENAIAEAAPFLTHLQLHGRETPQRCADLASAFGLDIIKALPVSVADDCIAAAEYAVAADLLIFDARPAAGAERPGGHGVPYDWTLLRHYAGATPFLVAGGLTPETVAGAVAAGRENAAFAGVDVSTGVEARPGVKDQNRLEAFVRAAQSAMT